MGERVGEGNIQRNTWLCGRAAHVFRFASFLFCFWITRWKRRSAIPSSRLPCYRLLLSTGLAVELGLGSSHPSLQKHHGNVFRERGLCLRAVEEEASRVHVEEVAKQPDKAGWAGEAVGHCSEMQEEVGILAFNLGRFKQCHVRSSGCFPMFLEEESRIPKVEKYGQTFSVILGICLEVWVSVPWWTLYPI